MHEEGLSFYFFPFFKCCFIFRESIFFIKINPFIIGCNKIWNRILWNCTLFHLIDLAPHKTNRFSLYCAGEEIFIKIFIMNLNLEQLVYMYL